MGEKVMEEAGAALGVLLLIGPLIGLIWFILTIILFFKVWGATINIKLGLLSIKDIQRNVRHIADALDKTVEDKRPLSSGDRDRDAAIDKMVREKYGEGWDD